MILTQCQIGLMLQAMEKHENIAIEKHENMAMENHENVAMEMHENNAMEKHRNMAMKLDHNKAAHVSSGVKQESHFIFLATGERLHLKRFYSDPEGPPILFLHGAIENGRIFYSNSGKGLAPYLAGEGFDCYVADLRGRGESRPRISRGASYGQTEAITEEIPAMAEYVRSLRPGELQIWIAHSWGGVLMASTLARFPKYISWVSRMVFFGTKRSVRAQNPTKWLYVDLIWNCLCPWLSRLWGYLPARRLGVGSDDETVSSLAHSVAWVKPSPWVDPDDGFAYGQAAKELEFPPVWFFVGGDDPALGNPMDVRGFAAEIGGKGCRVTNLSRAEGYERDYDHINMLTHPSAKREIYPEVARWIGFGRRDGGAITSER